MAKMNWANARYRNAHADIDRALARAGNIVVVKPKPKRRRYNPPVLLNRKHQFTQKMASHDSWRVIGADCPWNSTPGRRQVWHDGQKVE